MYVDANEAYLKALKTSIDPILEVKIIISIGYMHRRNGDYEEALKQFEIAKDNDSFSQIKDIKNTIILEKDYGFTLHYLGRFVDANNVLKNALKDAVRESFKEEVAHINNLIGYNLRYFNRLKRSLPYIKEGIKLRESIYGESHPNTAESYNNYAGNLRDLGQYDEAIEYHTKAYEIRKHLFGENHPDTSKSYNSLALYNYEIKEYQTSIEYNIKALDIRRRVFPDTHFYTSVTNRNLGMCYHQLGDKQKSLHYLSKALELRKSYYGQFHVSVANIYFDIAKVHSNNHDKELATINFHKTLDIYYQLYLTSPGEWVYFVNLLIKLSSVCDFKLQKNIDILGLNDFPKETFDDDLENSNLINFHFKF